MDGQTITHIVQVILAVVLVAVILVQVRGQGSGLFGSAEGGVRTRRGLELRLFQLTIALSVAFIGFAIVSVRVF